MNCPYCSNPVADGAAFCGNCGAKMDAQAAPAAAAAPLSEFSTTPEPVAAPVAPPVEPAPAFTPAMPTYTPPSLGVPPKKSNRNMIIIVVVVLLLLCCCCLVLGAAWWFMQAASNLPYSQGGFIFGTPTPRLK